MRRFHPANIRAALWAWRAARGARRQLARRSLEQIDLPPVPRLPAGAERGVTAVLRRTGSPCLPGALVRQAWHSAHGDPRDLVIGVTAPGDGFSAHAWLEGDPPCHAEQFEEIARKSFRE